MSIFNKDHYPTPPEIIDYMAGHMDLFGKTVLEPSAGSGNIVDFCTAAGAKVLACETSEPLQKILKDKCKLIAEDFMSLTSVEVSHIDYIIMNPPFSADERHIKHAYAIAPGGCEIVALCNFETLSNRYSRGRESLKFLIESFGSSESLGQVFKDSERSTGVGIGLVRLYKPKAAGSEDEWEGFFMDDEPEQQFEGIMKYDFIRDVVERYKKAVFIFDQQLLLAQEMNAVTSSFFSASVALNMTKENASLSRDDYKKDLQKSAWKFVFNKMNMAKYNTTKLQEQLNVFVEKQTKIPFTMKNIYKMLEIIVGTHSNRMDAALLEVFDKLTLHYKDNRHMVEGWVTNSHYLVNEKFIMPAIFGEAYSLSSGLCISHSSRSYELIEDLTKALCFITGKDFNRVPDLRDALRSPFWVKDKKGDYILKKHPYSNRLVIDGRNDDQMRGFEDLEEYDIEPKPYYGEWFVFGFFTIKGFKKGTGHFKFKDRDVWAQFNQHIARIKGYPLFEPKPSNKQS